MKQRVITAVVALAFFLPVIYVGGIAIELTAALLAGIGVFELFRMKGLAVLSFEGVLSILGAVILVLPKDPWFAFLPANTDKSALFYLIVLLLLGIAVVSKNMYTIDEAGFPVLVSLYVGVGFERFLTARLVPIVSAVVVAALYLLAFPGNDYFGHGSLIMIVLTIIFSIAGQFGDLVESAIKRHYGVKDSGNILPGHGGILDRFDSMLFVFPIMYLLGVF